MIENPLTLTKAQHTSWRHLNDNTKYDITLILPFQALIQEYGREGGYFISAGRVMKDSPLKVMSLYQDDLIIFELPIRVFQRSWEALPLSFRKGLSPDNNVRIHFLRRSQKDLNLLYATIEPCSAVERTFALGVYENSSAYVKKVFLYKSEPTKNEVKA